MKDDELMIVGLINEEKIEFIEKAKLKNVRIVFYDLIQVGPMFRTFINQLESNGKIEMGADLDMIELEYSEVFEVLKSPEYLKDVPRVSAHICSSNQNYIPPLVYEFARDMG